jgi:uncharacterized membrane protein
MAVVWLGGALMMQGFAIRANRSTDPDRMMVVAADIEFLGTRIFTPASLVLVLTGIGLVLNGDWSWGEPFVWLGLLVWLISFAAGLGYLGPESGRIAKAIEREGPQSAEARQRIDRIFVYSRIELVLLYGVVFMMVVKLGT